MAVLATRLRVIEFASPVCQSYGGLTKDLVATICTNVSSR